MTAVDVITPGVSAIGNRLIKLRPEHFFEEVAELTPRQFEYVVAWALQRRGLQAKVVGQTGDRGVDVVFDLARRPLSGVFQPSQPPLGIVQVKHYADGHTVGTEEMLRLVGSRQLWRARLSAFVTTSTFTPRAAEIGAIEGVTLIDRRGLLPLVHGMAIPGLNLPR